MPVQGLGVEETALAVAAPERRGRAARVLGVATASTSTVVPLGRLRRAAGAHLVPFPGSRSGASRALPALALEMQRWRCRRGCPSPWAAAATGCLDKAAARLAGRLSDSRWRGRAPPAAGELLGEETRQIVPPIFAVEFWLLGGVLKTPPGAPARAARALASATSIGFRLRILESKIAHPQLTAAPRGLSRRRGSRKGAAAGLPRDRSTEGSTPGFSESSSPTSHCEEATREERRARRRREEAPRAPQPWASSPRRKTLRIKTSRPRVPSGTVVVYPNLRRRARSASSATEIGQIY